jgi:hypothetical protein
MGLIKQDERLGSHHVQELTPGGLLTFDGLHLAVGGEDAVVVVGGRKAPLLNQAIQFRTMAVAFRLQGAAIGQRYLLLTISDKRLEVSGTDIVQVAHHVGVESGITGNKDRGAVGGLGIANHRRHLAAFAHPRLVTDERPIAPLNVVDGEGYPIHLLRRQHPMHSFNGRIVQLLGHKFIHITDAPF